ncbi:hypothetical protein TrST_g6464 [Triparma strigata]|uniref:Kinesin motor domain-containing protein n=2 Tax=Triparma strigata TaxID=1606541 RepID=A0A9W7DTD1_9STRA|nr:hypothetical protein TrST_g6464 [Triparma strigata]
MPRRSLSPNYRPGIGPDGALSSRKQVVTVDPKANNTTSSARRASRALTRRKTFSDIGNRKSSTAAGSFPRAAAGRGKLTSRDECRLTGAWITWHLLIDGCHAVMRGALKHWWRQCLFDDLQKRHSVVEKLEIERKEFLQEREELQNERREFERNSKDVEKELSDTRTRANSSSVLVESLTETATKKESRIKDLEERLAAAEADKRKLEGNYLELVDKSIKLNHLVSKVASLPAVNPDDIQTFFEHVASESKSSGGGGSKSAGRFVRKMSSSPIKRRTFTEDTDYFTERRRRSHIASPSVHVVPSSSFFDQSATLGNSLTTFQNSQLNPANAAEEQPKEEQPKEEALAKEDDHEVDKADDSDMPEILNSDTKDEGRKDSANVPSSPSKPALKHAESFRKKSSVQGPKRGPVRPSASSQMGRKQRTNKINEIGEELWKKINEPQDSGASNAVAVAVRVRPLNKREIDLKSDICVQMSEKSIALVEPLSQEKSTFTFDYCFDTVDPNHPNFADQETVFKSLGIDILRNAWEGYNACLFAYGQTGAGKSWSITGSHEHPGIIPMFCDKLFYFIEHHSPPNTTTSVEASYLEIYNERVQDLLNPDGSNLKVREHPITGVFVEGLSFCAVDCYDDVELLMDEGTAARTIGATNMNASSSRSHSIFEIVITQELTDTVTGGVSEKQSRVVLIDLAGSERAGSTGATGTRLKEGAQINKSLSALGQCIRALSDAFSHGDHHKVNLQKVPFRNSVLTMLLKNSLVGNAKTTMLAAVSPADTNYSESLSTLRYAQSAKKITTKAVVNEDPTAKLIKDLREEVERLKMEKSSGFAGPQDGGAILEVEALMLERSMTKDAKRQQTERLKKRRKTILAMTGQSTNTEEAYRKNPHLSNMNQDPSLSGSLKLIISDGTVMKIGRKDADEAQDVQLEGLGMKKAHCVIENRTGRLFIKQAEKTADIYVNGTKLDHGEEKEIKNKDMLVFGVCTHLYQVIIPKIKTSFKPKLDTFEEGDEEENEDNEENLVALDESGAPVDDDDTTMTYQEAIRQVVLGRPETLQQKQVRLAHLVLSQWRRPVFKRLFEERLVEALRFCQESNQIATEMYTPLHFSIHLSCAVRLDDAASLSMREIIKYEYVHINIRTSTKEEEDEEEDDTYKAHSKDWLCECGRVAFGEFLDTLRSNYVSFKPLCVRSGVEQDNPADEPVPEVVDLLFKDGKTEVTLQELHQHLKAVDSSSLDINKPLLRENASNVLHNSIIDDDSLMDKDEAAEIVKKVLQVAFDDSIAPLVEEFGRQNGGGRGAGGGGGGIDLSDLEMYKGRLLETIGNSGTKRSAVMAEIAKEFEAIKERVGNEFKERFKEINLDEGSIQESYRIVGDDKDLKQSGSSVSFSGLDKVQEVERKLPEKIKNSNAAKDIEQESDSPIAKTKLEYDEAGNQKAGEGEVSEENEFGVESQSTGRKTLDNVNIGKHLDAAAAAAALRDSGADHQNDDEVHEDDESWKAGDDDSDEDEENEELAEFYGGDGGGIDDWELKKDPEGDFFWSESRQESKWQDEEDEKEEEEAEAEGEGDGGIDDWELKKDPEGDFFWSESRQESKWADEEDEDEVEEEEEEEGEAEAEAEAEANGDGGIDDWELKKDPGGDFFWSESRQESKWPDEEDEEEEVSAETENEERDEEEKAPSVADVAPPRSESRNSMLKPAVDFDDLSGDEFDLDGELPPQTELHRYESDDQVEEKHVQNNAQKEEEGDGGIDDWELKEDPEGDYYWSESRQESKWADDDEEEDEEGEVEEDVGIDDWELKKDPQGDYYWSESRQESKWADDDDED